MFNIEIAGQMAAWFLGKTQGNSMPHLKLIKLLYLAERTSIQRNNYPILGDELFSMPHGPVLSRTLDYMKSHGPPENGWNKWVSPIENNEVSLAREYDPEDLDLLSEATLDVLDEVWNLFGDMGKWEISDYTHKKCNEWQDPHDSSIPITYEEVLRALGYENQEAAKAGLELEIRREAAKALLT